MASNAKSRRGLSLGPSQALNTAPDVEATRETARLLQKELTRIRTIQLQHTDDISKLREDMCDLIDRSGIGTIAAQNQNDASPPVPALRAKLERERLARLGVSPSNQSVLHLEARMDAHDAKLRTLIASIAKLVEQVKAQTAQLGHLTSNRTDTEIAGLRTDLAAMNAWCAEFTTNHNAALERCRVLENKLEAAEAEVARLRTEPSGPPLPHTPSSPDSEASFVTAALETPPPKTPMPRHVVASHRQSKVWQHPSRAKVAATPKLPAIAPESPFNPKWQQLLGTHEEIKED